MDMNLSESEKHAKAYMALIVKEAVTKPCETGNGSIISINLPTWYDSSKYKRGQKYYSENRYGMLQSNMCGLITLLAVPKGLQILSLTGQSSCPLSARRRYVSTILHLISWYESDLTPGSKSWKSLTLVRKMHLSASNASAAKNVGYISQSEMALTTFGFMGFALSRPHLLGIAHDNDDDREGFIHFWAVIGHLLGVEDKYNMCLYPVETVVIICKMLLRYVFIPLIQLESAEFKFMVDAMIQGMASFLPRITYENQMFIVKRIVGIPGYQYDVDVKNERLCRQIFSNDELDELRNLIHTGTGLLQSELLFLNDIPLLEKSDFHMMKRKGNDTHHDNNNSRMPLTKFCKLDNTDQMVVEIYPEEKWLQCLNDSKLYALKRRDKVYVMMRCRFLRLYKYRIGSFFCELLMSLILFLMRNWSDLKKL